MNTHILDQKKQLILDHESQLAHKLALLTLDKPKPPIWMIFVPVFFVFFVQKMNQYKSGLAEFVENYLKSRRHALEAALAAEETAGTANLDALLDKAGNIPEHARPLYRDWMAQLVAHYQLLLTAKGSSHAALVRSGYQSKTNYLLFCNCLNKAENAYSTALLPEMDGDNQDLRHVIDKIDACVTHLRREEADSIFS